MYNYKSNNNLYETKLTISIILFRWINKENYALLRITKKIITATEKAEKDETEEFAITLDKEEAKLYKELFDKKN